LDYARRMRLDVYLHQQYPEISRAALQRFIKEGKVLVNKKPQIKASYLVDDSDTVELRISTKESPATDTFSVDVLYEDNDCVVVNKPEGMLTHSKGAFNPEVTVASWLARRSSFDFIKDDVNPRQGIVHRLDRATSGVMIGAKNPTALKHLQKQFQDKKAKKVYVARVEGELNPEVALIDLPIERNPKSPQRFRVGQNGKPAQTKYRVKKILGADSVVTLQPLTGRTHQIRVHLNYIKHPIVGDTFYGGRTADRLYLHASDLEITLPNKNRRTFSANVPRNFYKENA
jgi:23S rRNA pseudouridine1911/1915/1917 synthase